MIFLQKQNCFSITYYFWQQLSKFPGKSFKHDKEKIYIYFLADLDALPC